MPTAKNALIEQVESLSVPVLQQQGMELVDLDFVHEHGQWVLRFFLDKPGGITLDDCANVSDQLGRLLDASDVIAQAYSLEVSSPGLNRSLRKEKDFQKFTGERADITLYAPLNGRRHFKCTLRSAANGAVVVEDANRETFELQLANIAKAKLDPEIDV